MHPTITRAFNDYSNGDFDNALLIVRTHLKNFPQDTDAYMLLAATHAANKDYKKVIEACEAVLTYDPANDRALYNAAIAHRTSGDLNAAESCVRDLLHNDDLHLPANLFFIELLLNKACFEEARYVYTRIRNLILTDQNILFQIAGLFVNFKFYDLAEEVVKILDKFQIDNKNITNEINRYHALICFNTRRYDESREFCRSVIGGNPRSAGSYHYLGNIHDLRGEYEKSINAYVTALRITPELTNTQYNLSLVYEKSGKYLQAFNILNTCVNSFKGNEASILLLRVLSHLENKEGSEDVYLQLTGLIENKQLDPKPLAKIAYDSLLSRHTFLKKLIALSIEGRDSLVLDRGDVQDLNRCRFLHLYLANISNISMDFESFISSLRSKILEQTMSGSGFNFSLDLCSSLALQCYKSGYVYMVTENEKSILDKRLHDLADKESSGETALMYVCVIAMYYPVHEIAEYLPAGFKAKSGSTFYNDMIQQQYTNVLTERKISEQLLLDEEISDSTSGLVKAMYENNPYPVWDRVNMQSSRTIKDIIKDVSPEFKVELAENDLPSVLIAGCGTGQHATLNAIRLKSADITAIDLSLPSLSFARRMAEKYGIDRISFKQLDILNVSRLDRRFDVIESVGVLHHMDDTSKGLACLKSVLKPGGLICIGLYSTLGRRYINMAKTSYHRGEARLSDDDIRERRYLLVQEKDQELKENILSFSEFYKLNECRDMIFHEHEHTFSLKEINTMLKTLDLKFIGFEFSDTDVRQDYRKSFPDDEDQTDLENWSVYEEANPDTFASMYVFWCAKKTG